MTGKPIITKEEFYAVVKQNKGLLHGIPDTKEAISEYYGSICCEVTGYEFVNFIRSHRTGSKFWPAICEVYDAFQCNFIGIRCTFEDLFKERLEPGTTRDAILNWCIARFPNCRPFYEGTYEYDNRTEEQIKWKAIEQQKALNEYIIAHRKEEDFHGRITAEYNNLIEHKGKTLKLSDIDFGVYNNDEILLIDNKENEK